MGSSGQHYGGPDQAFTEDSVNTTEYVTNVASTTRWSCEPPRPDWSEMVGELRWTWELHVYVIASLFSVLAVLCLFTVLRLRAQLSRSRNQSSLNVFLGILATARLLVLYLDPYGSKKVLPPVMRQVLWDLGYPCLVSAFSLLQLAVIREAEVKMAILDESAASIIITFHFCLIITSGVLCALQSSLRTMWLITQVIFIIWGGFLFFSTLLGCLRLLRSIVKVPLRYLTQQVDPGSEVSSVPLGMFTEVQPQEGQRHQEKQLQLHPRIRITDVDDQTYSYASTGSLAMHPEQQQRGESFPIRYLTSASPVRAHPPQTRSKPTSPNDDPATIKPLIDEPRTYTAKQKSGSQGPSTIFGFVPSSPNQSLPPSLMPSIFSEDIRTDACKLKSPCRSRFVKNLRHLVFTSSLGIILCLLKAYDVFGPYGPLSSGKDSPLRPWFFFQTIHRFVELIMAYAMVCGSQRSMNNRYYYYHT